MAPISVLAEEENGSRQFRGRFRRRDDADLVFGHKTPGLAVGAYSRHYRTPSRHIVEQLARKDDVGDCPLLRNDQDIGGAELLGQLLARLQREKTTLRKPNWLGGLQFPLRWPLAHDDEFDPRSSIRRAAASISTSRPCFNAILPEYMTRNASSRIPCSA